MISADQEERARLLRKIGQLMSVAPKSSGNWSYNRAVDFKAAVVKAKKVIKKPRATINELSSMANTLERFHA